MVRKIVILFHAGKGDRAGRFRHVVGSNVIEVADKDALGAPRWNECGQNRSPLSVYDLTRRALELMCKPLELECAVRGTVTWPVGVRLGSIGDVQTLEIELGEAGAYGCRA